MNYQEIVTHLLPKKSCRILLRASFMTIMQVFRNNNIQNP
jgi:hypothetical protein